MGSTRSTRLWFVLAVAMTACSRPKTSEAPPQGSAGATADASPEPVAARASPPDAAPAAPRCEDAPVHLFVAPGSPSTKSPLRVLATSDRPLEGELSVAVGEASARSAERHGGPPYFWIAEVDRPSAGAATASFTERACEPGRGKTTKQITVTRKVAPRISPPKDGVWRARKAWSRPLENVYSAWIEVLFDAPDGEMPSWTALHEVLRDPKRNLLFDYLGAGEDGPNAPVIRPDCADLPYFLRAYFAFKLGLPFGVSECDRGGGGAPPSCNGIVTNEDADARASSAAAAKPQPSEAAVAAFGAFLRGTLANRAHSGSARAPFEDESADYYPVPLTWDSLRPGTIYADPYGHILMVAKRLPQTSERGGVLLAVDGQPDGTVARKRYWRGNFLYATDPALGGPGFKRFRPVGRKAGRLARLSDAEIGALAGYGDVSREARALDREGFYDRMDDVLSPAPLDPTRAMMEKIAALEEQVQTRVKSVDNGRKWLASAHEPVEMPEGAEIFETNGPWEDFSTPSRDLRLLIAIDVVRGFPARIGRRPQRYAMPPGKSPDEVKAELTRTLDRELASRRITYTRTDGSPFTLSLAEVLARSRALELAYDPNDCVELRWGAAPGSDEASTCRAHAPAEQRARMESYRPWFAERRRPPRK